MNLEIYQQKYEAYFAWFKLLNSPAYQYSFRLEPRDCMIIQNFRVLHGRKAFDRSSAEAEAFGHAWP
ncbi:TauD/TfdA family dioxygenase [Moorena sp. SIO3H5]|uniref:TauD/TfdA family dioxygenase n=1 Tax=Moorena sp. SIO3H5 TaxID=2607834 RepID=UPI0013B9B756|nr:TauD/TfdA family dioxygenase [Moorena sp. SIO3H5]NEO73054.1 hypothetical protein [Moorena sp. SIO3H5]